MAESIVQRIINYFFRKKNNYPPIYIDDNFISHFISAGISMVFPSYIAPILHLSPTILPMCYTAFFPKDRDLIIRLNTKIEQAKYIKDMLNGHYINAEDLRNLKKDNDVSIESKTSDLKRIIEQINKEHQQYKNQINYIFQAIKEVKDYLTLHGSSEKKVLNVEHETDVLKRKVLIISNEQSNLSNEINKLDDSLREINGVLSKLILKADESNENKAEIMPKFAKMDVSKTGFLNGMLSSIYDTIPPVSVLVRRKYKERIELFISSYLSEREDFLTLALKFSNLLTEELGIRDSLDSNAYRKIQMLIKELIQNETSFLNETIFLQTAVNEEENLFPKPVFYERRLGISTGKGKIYNSLELYYHFVGKYYLMYLTGENNGKSFIFFDGYIISCFIPFMDFIDKIRSQIISQFDKEKPKDLEMLIIKLSDITNLIEKLGIHCFSPEQGERFDPKFHEDIFPTGIYNNQLKVTDTLYPGYMEGEKLIRKAVVEVNG